MQTPPGWYRDPHRPDTERWWDGAAWTASSRPVVVDPVGRVSAPTPRRGSRTRELAALCAVLVVVVGVVIAAVVAHHDDAPAALTRVVREDAAPVPASGSDYVESNGTYSLRVGDGWQEAQLASGAAWYTGTGSRTFRDNVTVIVEDLPRRVPLEDYVTISAANAERVGISFEEDSRREVVLSDGRTAISLDYSSQQQGFGLRHRVLITVHDLVAVSITFTSERDRFDSSVADVDAYLRTLQVR